MESKPHPLIAIARNYQDKDALARLKGEGSVSVYLLPPETSLFLLSTVYPFKDFIFLCRVQQTQELPKEGQLLLLLQPSLRPPLLLQVRLVERVPILLFHSPKL